MWVLLRSLPLQSGLDTAEVTLIPLWLNLQGTKQEPATSRKDVGKTTTKSQVQVNQEELEFF